MIKENRKSFSDLLQNLKSQEDGAAFAQAINPKKNALFEPIARLNSITEDYKNKQGSISAALSNLVGPAG